MEIKKPKSHTPTIHDNTEKDLILVPPSVLDNKLRDLEEHQRVRGTIASDIALAITLLVAVLTSTFNDQAFIKGSTIRGAFITGFIVILIKIGYGIYKIYQTDKKARINIINDLKIPEVQ
jgi:hypothetical protein